MPLFKKDLKIRLMGDKLLYEKAKEIPLKDIKKKEFQDFLDDMIWNMKKKDGVGLSAPQVGVSERLFVVAEKIFLGKREDREVKFEQTIFINPVIVSYGDKEATSLEGCLSMPRLYGNVPRSKTVRIKAFDREGKPFEIVANDFYARVIQHEFDHLNGILFLDRMRDLRTLRFE